MFKQFGHIVYKCGAYRVEEIEKGKLYVAIHMYASRREKWCRISYKVTVLDGEEEFDYECGQFSHMGLLRSHALKVLVIMCADMECKSYIADLSHIRIIFLTNNCWM